MGNDECLPPPPPFVPFNFEQVRLGKNLVELVKKKLPTKVLIARRGLGTKGDRISLVTNHLKVNVVNPGVNFFQYSVAISYGGGCPVVGTSFRRNILDKVKKTYNSELNWKELAYDGDKTLFTIGKLPQRINDFNVVMEDVSSNRNNGSRSLELNESPNDSDRPQRSFRSKIYNVIISYASEIPVQSIIIAVNALRGNEPKSYQEAIRVLYTILRQHAVKQGCLLVRRNFFYRDHDNFTYLEDGVDVCRGLHSSFIITQSGLSLNIDVSTTITVHPGPVIDFLIKNQNLSDPARIDWAKAKRTLKNLRIKTSPSNQEYRIRGLSDLPCNEQMFFLKKRGSEAREDDSEIISVYNYFVTQRQISLEISHDLRCINVGTPKRPTYIPIELCELVPLQRYTKALTTSQRSSLVKMSRQKPQERKKVLIDRLRISNYNSEPMLRQSGISITSRLTQVDGRVLQAPRLISGNMEDFNPINGKWNFHHKEFYNPVKILKWFVMNFSTHYDVPSLVKDLINCGKLKGMHFEQPLCMYKEQYDRGQSPKERVEELFKSAGPILRQSPTFILCLLPNRNSDLYGPVKKKCLVELGIMCQCIVPPSRVCDQYLTSVLLKINAKLGGLNSVLGVEYSSSILVTKSPTLILGMGVFHGSPHQSDIPSIAAVVSSREWPLISKYRACVRTQRSKVEMIDNLFKQVSDCLDEGIIREILLDFYTSSMKRAPDNIIIFRQGVSECQFNQVLNVELAQIIEACKFLDNNWNPKFTVIVAQKNHHTKFFQPRSTCNVPAGTVVDNMICHPRNYDFYMCAHTGSIGTSRPTHYHVLWDDIGFSPDDLQELVHSLSYVDQRCTNAVSVVAPICYAHLAASQIGQFLKFEDRSETALAQAQGFHLFCHCQYAKE